MKTPTILVTDAERSCAVSIIRSLGRRGWRVIAGSSNPRSAGLRSRFAHEKLIYPVPNAEPDRFLDEVYDAVIDRHIDLIIPVTDNVIPPLVDARERFEKVCRLAIAPTASLEVTRNKRKTFDLARYVGVPFPRTQQVHTAEEALEHAPELGWPLVLKPQVSHLYHDQESVIRFSVAYAKDKDDLVRQMRQFEGLCPVLLQEYFIGTGQGVEVLMHEGKPLAAFQHKRLREVPISGGASALRESVPLDPALYDYSLRLLQELKWTGLAMVEFKVGENNAQLMEINGRIWGSLPLAIFSGVDFPGRLVEMCLSNAVAHDDCATSYKVGVRAHSLQKELSWIAEVLRGKHEYPYLNMPTRVQGLAAILDLFHPFYKFDVLSLTDPGPGLTLLANVFAASSTLFRRRQDSSNSGKSPNSHTTTGKAA